ncbi:MAG: TIGR02281 family clan AA aspartic protease [Rhodospirillaceae bacterium]|nr:TIGR02281 family clan AA aspartic protease [Rhodospirillaceae bacterium]MDE0616944.1 TIGR02281 family clan AA aspartic protease [Rhodospirillaceae bacterium]MXY39347.1 TIGR02281 family clan AA aspartic protease [Rhodospirillaceae bacterium]MYF08620.1 TIGR02281 family clan AA aspartic protease [Rhodospirillaceae bacterium]MYH37932.1 TIGR02281 family clan AA aspartic protease [Rhodospirillaceae bacterium]
MEDPWGFGGNDDRRRGRGSASGDTVRDLLPAFLIVAAILGGLAAAGWLLGEAFGVFDSAEDGLYAGLLIALLIFLGGGLMMRGRHRIGGILKSILAWSAIGLVAVAGYAYRHELTMVWQRVAGELSPGTAVYGERSLTVRASGSGAFFLDVFLNGRPARMLVDTGATGVALSPADAVAAGLDVGRLRYTVPVQTADGAALAAHAVLDSIQVGGLTFRNQRALVLRQGQISLLGVTVLRRFRSFEISGDRLTLRW